MVSGDVKRRLKVVWLCHLNNGNIEKKLGIKPSFEFAPWMNSFAEIFKKFDKVDIHIIAPHGSIIRKKMFVDRNICYHFFPYRILGFPKRIFNYLHLKTDYKWNKRFIRKEIESVNPDVIHLFGTENAYFTSAILQFKDKYPVFVTVQGIANHITTVSKNVEYMKMIETKIIQNFYNFGVRDEEMKLYLKSVNPEIKFFNHEIAPYVPKIKSSLEKDKKYDIVFFARVTKDKGIEDLIDALIIVKERNVNIKVAVIGPIAKQYMTVLNSRIEKYKLKNNIELIGPKNSIDEVHEYVAKSRLCVLPTHADTIPGTIIESMFIGTPCVSYSVGGIPTLNEAGEIIKLTNIGNIEQLARYMINLLSNGEERIHLANLAQKYVKSRWGDEKIHNKIIDAYKDIII